MEDDERPYKSRRKERESSVASSTSSRKVGPPKKRQDVQESRDTASATYQASSSNANSSGIYHQALPSRPGSVASDRNSPRPTLHRQATGNSTRTHHSGNSESRVNSPAPSHKSASIKALSRVNTGSSNSSKSSAGRASAVSSSNDSGKQIEGIIFSRTATDSSLQSVRVIWQSSKQIFHDMAGTLL